MSRLHESENCHYRCGTLHDMSVLTINAGSSSIRFAFYGIGEPPAVGDPPAVRAPPAKLLDGKIERIGLEGTSLIVNELERGAVSPRRLDVNAGRSSVGGCLHDGLARDTPAFCAGERGRPSSGARHEAYEPGARDTRTAWLSSSASSPYDPEHLPREIGLIETMSRRFPRLPQVACFDTAFHRSMPRVATIMPIPRRYESKGVQRYGFHGLSYTFLMQELARAGRSGAPRAAASSSRISATARVSPPSATGIASTPAWVSRRRRDW